MFFLKSQEQEVKYLEKIQDELGLSVIYNRWNKSYKSQLKNYRRKWEGWVNVLDLSESTEINNYFDMIKERWYTGNIARIGEKRMMDFIYDNIVHLIFVEDTKWNVELSAALEASTSEEMIIILILYKFDEKSYGVIHKPPWNYVTYDINGKFLEDNGGRDINSYGCTQGSKFDSNQSFPGIIGALHKRHDDFHFYLGDTTQTYNRNKAVGFSFYVLADAGAVNIWTTVVCVYFVGSFMMFVTHSFYQGHFKRGNLIDRGSSSAFLMIKIFLSHYGTLGASYSGMMAGVLDSVIQGLEKVMVDPKFAVFAGRQKLLFDTIRLGGEKVFHLNDFPFFVKYKCVAFRNGSPLQEMFNHVILQLHAGGIIDKITRDEYFGTTRRIGEYGKIWEEKYEKQNVVEDVQDERITKIAMKHINGIFYVFNIKTQSWIEHYKFLNLFNRDDMSGRIQMYYETYVKGYNGIAYGIASSEGILWQNQRRFSLMKLKNLGFGKKSIEIIIYEQIINLFEMIETQKDSFNDLFIKDIFTIPVVNVLWKIVASKSYDWRNSGERKTGAETTNTTLVWALLYMSLYEGVQEKCAEEINSVLGSRMPQEEDMKNLPYTIATLNEIQRLCKYCSG
ncbi:unnamed protein product [Lepeophtheirus salmonis]|uniref:(salmon louse) hypothetical protein n=1 Tax=Lepeophtheirus salmonis TaxID=72036 RepID=A0A7R8GZL2_LEPSM|nr:unnamed protein product [Lepeophtheirus salmonis]CAF2768325.1 unnamed protein product [Lepeophtheirus salmonis]